MTSPKKRNRRSPTPWPVPMLADPMDTRCTATARQTGERCRNRPVPGALVCRFHGGKAPQVRRAAARRLVEGEARTLLQRLGQPSPLGNPVEELLALGAEVRAWQAVLREKVAVLDRLDHTDKTGAERARALVDLYGQSLDRSHRVLSDLVRLGLEDRLVRMTEAEAAMMFTVFMSAMSRAGLPGQYHDPLREAMASELRAVAAGGGS